MKLLYVVATSLLFTLLFFASTTQAQQNNDLINILLKKNIINQKEADSLRAEQAANDTAKKQNQHGITIGSRALQISGLIQTEYEGFESPTAYNTFLVHRARLDIKGNIDDQWSYEVYTEFAGVTPKLLDAYTSYKIADFLTFNAGQFKVPFSLESLIADSQLDFIDRSQVVNALSSRSTDVLGNNIGRDIGIQINGSFVKIDNRYLFDYTLGLFDGAGYDVTTDNNNHKDLAGRFSIHPIDNLSISADFYDGVALYIVSGAKTATNNVRDRKGVDARYVLGRLALQAEYDRGTDASINRDGWYGQATYYVLPKYLQLAARYDTYDPNEIETHVRTNYRTGGINYFFNNWARLEVNYVDVQQPGEVVKKNIFETQLQLTF
jgi:phosphate-selective porin OprO/OprP